MPTTRAAKGLKSIFKNLPLDSTLHNPEIDRLTDTIARAAITDTRLRARYNRDIHTKYKAEAIVYLLQGVAHALEPLFWNIAGAVVYDTAKTGVKKINNLELDRRVFLKIQSRISSVQRSIKKVRRFLSKNKLINKPVSDLLARYSDLIDDLKNRGPAFKKIVRAIKKRGLQ